MRTFPQTEAAHPMTTKPRMPVVYVAGPYRARTRAGVELNIQTARRVGALAATKGWSPLIPHANTGHLDEVCEHHDEFWLDATLELMRRCDAVVLCPGWMDSSGTIAEIAEAKRIGIPVYEAEHQLPHAKFAAPWNVANDNARRG